jgi:hypothetical protein
VKVIGAAKRLIVRLDRWRTRRRPPTAAPQAVPVNNAPLLPTPYELRGRDEPIALATVNGRLLQKGAQVASGDVGLSLIWLPHPNVRFEMNAEPWLVDTEPGNLELDFPQAVTVPVSVGRVHVGATSEIAGNLSDRAAHGDTTDVDAISFLLANWPAMRGEWITKPGAGGWLGRVVLESPPWRVTLEVRRDNRELVDELRAFGGYAVTHVGRLERIDGARFSVADGRDVLEALNLFLSLARGLWTPPLLPVGYDGQAIVWREWIGRTSSPWRATFAWFSPWQPQTLTDAWPLFMQRWQDSQWRDSLTLGIWWYIEANGEATAETSLLLCQVALELFSWVILVQEQAQLTRKQHKDTSAEDNIRALLQWAQIPLAIPAEHATLTQYAAAEGWADGPTALIRLRNKLTHPGGKAATIFAVPAEARVELRQLALWYVELVLLRFQDYRGDYLVRHRAGHVGDVERVPWP